MSFLALTLKNLVRQRTRTILTVVGITIGITTVVALGAVTGGLRKTSAQFVTAGGADFMLGQDGASDMTFSTVPVAEWQQVRGRPDVARTSAFLIEVSAVRDKPYFLFFGYDPASLRREPATIVEGTRPDQPRDAMIGTTAARDLGLGVGDTLPAKDMRLRIVGVYRAGDMLRDSGAIVSLATAGELSGKHGVVTGIHVTAAPGVDPAALAADIERRIPQLAAIRTADDYSKIDQGFKTLDALNLAISVLAVGIGAIGVMNTMIMSVFDRTREIGILRAVGWRGSRILRMILAESLVLCLIAVVAGTALGVAASRGVLLVPAISSFLTPAYAWTIFVRGLVVGVVVALSGAIYPAIYAVRLSPMEALRHE